MENGELAATTEFVHNAAPEPQRAAASLAATRGGAVDVALFVVDQSGARPRPVSPSREAVQDALIAGRIDSVDSSVAALVRDETGNLYGTASQGGFAGCASSVRSGCGTVFKLSPEGKLTVLHRFTGTGTDGGIPLAGLILDETGDLYGTASVGGSFSTARCVSLDGCGTIFKIGEKGKFSVLYSFLGSPIDGATPTAELIRDSKGNLYGASNDGLNYTGEIFKLSPAGHETVLYSFATYPSPDGAGPSRLVRDAEGNFYGTAAGGGTGGINSTGLCPGMGCGTVFKLDPAGNLTVLADLGSAEAPGSVPKSGVILDHEGNLYGVGTGTNCKLGVDCGEVFKIAP
ncbi:MAG: choice-of-anchor tandem repeat GloVer-containing protein [Candidatus Sulfotelmatobacter sp.]